MIAPAGRACQAARQRALLHVLACDFDPAAKLLATAPGRDWSSSAHPGHLLFALFTRLLGDSRKQPSARADSQSHPKVDLDELDLMTRDRDVPRLATPEVDALLELAGVDRISDAAARAVVLAAMKKAAESRVTEVTEQKRRRHYEHAAELVATCVSCDPTSETTRWAAALKAEYRRFPALRDALERALGAR